MNNDNDIRIKVKQNLTKIVNALQKNGMKTVKIAHAMGFAAKRQLDSTLEGKCTLSIKVIGCLTKNLNINPTYLLLGKGNMFLPDETELDILQKENQELTEKCVKYSETIIMLNIKTNKQEKRMDDLFEIYNSAIKYYKGEKT